MGSAAGALTESRPTAFAAPFIPAKAGIQTVSDKTATRNHVRIASDKFLPPLWGKVRMGVSRASSPRPAASESLPPL